MRACIIIKVKRKFPDEVAELKAKEELEWSLQDLEWVHRAIADMKNLKVDIEYDDNDEDFSFDEIITAVQDTGKFLVLTVLG